MPEPAGSPGGPDRPAGQITVISRRAATARFHCLASLLGAMLEARPGRHGRLRDAGVTRGCPGSVMETSGRAVSGLRRHTVNSHLKAEGAARRWVIERTLAWATRHRRNARDYERLPAHHETYIYRAMIIVTRRLARKPSATAQPQVT